MIWILVISAIVLLLLVALVALLCWAFKTAFKRSDIRLIDVNVGPIAEYKDVFSSSLEYIDTLPCERLYAKSFDGLRLAGNYYNNNSDTTILLFHGYRSDGKFDFSCAVKFYFELGLNVLVVDQRANGESEGKYITFGIKERRDVLSWIELINQKYAPKYVFISGVSMGATSVMMASNLNLPENVKGIIADCGYTSAPEIIKRVSLRAFKINATPILPALNLMCKVLGRFNLYETTTQKSLSESEIPIFFIHGMRDDFVPCEMTKRSYESARGKKYMHLVEEADHGISFLVDTKNIQDKITVFINENCA